MSEPANITLPNQAARVRDRRDHPVLERDETVGGQCGNIDEAGSDGALGSSVNNVQIRFEMLDGVTECGRQVPLEADGPRPVAGCLQRW